jgi:hypothetical protein
VKQPRSGRERPVGDTVHDGTPQVTAQTDAEAQDKAGAGRSPAPRPRPGGTGARRLDRRPPGPPASGSFPANAAWLVLAAITHNLLRAAGSLASLAYGKARGATIRRDLIDVAARTARHGRRPRCTYPTAGTANTNG